MLGAAGKAQYRPHLCEVHQSHRETGCPGPHGCARDGQPGGRVLSDPPRAGGNLRGAVFLQLPGPNALCTLQSSDRRARLRGANPLQSALNCECAQAPCKGANTYALFALDRSRPPTEALGQNR